MFKKFTAYLGDDIPIEEITHKHIEGFFTAQTRVSNKTLLNYHTGHSSLWTLALREHMCPELHEKILVAPFIGSMD